MAGSLSNNSQLCVVSVEVLIKMKLIFLGLTIVSIVGFKFVVSVSGDEISILNITTLKNDNNSIATIDKEIELNSSGLENANASGTFKSFRLPETVLPRHYKLEVLHILDDITNETNPNINETLYKRFTSPGKVWIDVDVLEGVNNVTLHAEDMEIGDVKICLSNCTNQTDFLEIHEVLRDKDVNFLTVVFKEKLSPGSYKIYIEFVSRIADDRLNGLYLDYYEDTQTKQKRFLATTLFAPHHARKAFPCFDEPAMRATFDITIGHKTEKYFSLSNMERISTRPMEELADYVWDSFARTPPMSTYIVAMITCDFNMRKTFYENKNNSSVTITTYVPDYLLNYQKHLHPNSSWPTDFSHTMTEKVMPAFGSIFGEEYPLKNLKTISLPHFYFNAMENWGLMTFKYPVLIDIQNLTTETERLKIADVLGHEISHQWFGNLVGMKFWTYVWLKEGFSTFYSSYATEIVYPQFYPWVHFTTQNFQVALDFDEGLESHPLENVPETSAAIGEIYTHIPYKKGASVLRMTEAFMTREAFTKGVQLYVKRMKYKAPDQDDLFQALEDSKNKHVNESTPIKDILDTWTKQSGFPVVKVRVEDDKKILVLKQEKFINPHIVEIKKLENSSFTPNENASWWIPITFWPKTRCVNSFKDVDWIPKDEKEIFIDYKYSQGLFLVNPDGIGFYRVLYEDSNVFNRIYNQLMTNHTVLKAVSRSQLLDDYFSFAFADYVPVEIVFNMTQYLHKETELIVWKSVLTNLEKVYKLMRDTENFEHLKDYILRKLVPAWKFSKNQLKDLQDITEKTRLHSLLLEYVCLYDPMICGDSSKAYFKTWVDDPSINPIPADEQTAIYCAIISTSNSSKSWEFLENVYKNESYSVQKYRLVKALSCVNDKDTLEKLLNWTTDPAQDLHDVDKVQLIKYVAENKFGKSLLFKFLDVNFHSLFKNVSAANPIVEGLKAIVPYCNSKEDLLQLEEFIKKFSEELGSKKKSLEKEVRKVKLNILWMESFSEKIGVWAKEINSGEDDAQTINNNKFTDVSKDFVEISC